MPGIETQVAGQTTEINSNAGQQDEEPANKQENYAKRNKDATEIGHG